MTVSTLDAWVHANQLAVVQPLKDIGVPGEGPIIAIDAPYYIERYRSPSREPLVSALGGFPLNMEFVILKEIKEIESCGCKMVFYFDGLDCGFDESRLQVSAEAMSNNSKAFAMYEPGDALGAIDIFKQSGLHKTRTGAKNGADGALGFPDPHTLHTFLKVVLHRHEVPFVVAPFKAHAQMIHSFLKGTVDAMYGASELLLYGAEKIITKFSLVHEMPDAISNHGNQPKSLILNSDLSTFTWFEIGSCLKSLGDIPKELFLDAMYLSGSSVLETFPPLKDPLQHPQPFTFRNAIDLLVSGNGNVFRVCDHYSHDSRLSQLSWADHYMRAVQSIRHMIVLFNHDSVKPRSVQNKVTSVPIPTDLHELIGLALPEELQYYMFCGIIDPKVLNWLIRGRIDVQAPYAGGESEVYRKLVKDEMMVCHKQVLSILACSINRYYQQKEIKVCFWFGLEHDQRFNMKDVISPKQQLFTWRVETQYLTREALALKATGMNAPLRSFHFAILSLKNPEFATQTMGAKPSSYKPLQTLDEIVCNVIWRFLYLKGYTDENHELTRWGQLLSTVLEHLPYSREQSEAAFLAVELFRLGLLTPADFFPSTSGGPTRGSELDRRNCTLVSRLACVGKMKHGNKGYSGPLSLQLLAYHSLIATVRAGLRDLVEISLVVLLLEADAQRVREDFLLIAESLPFQEHFSCGLGVITKTYLDELGASEQPSKKDERSEIMNRAESWFSHTDVRSSFDLACDLWFAVSFGIQKCDSSVVDDNEKGMWSGIDGWLLARRP